MKITAQDLKDLGIVDRIITENDDTMRNLKKLIYETFKTNKKIKVSKLLNERFKKYRMIGEVHHVSRDR